MFLSPPKICFNAIVYNSRDGALSNMVKKTPRLTQVVPKVVPRNVQAEGDVEIVD